MTTTLNWQSELFFDGEETQKPYWNASIFKDGMLEVRAKVKG